jgi:hypothetical protein
MKTKEVSVSIVYTKNLGNYESLKLEAGIVITPELEETYEDLFKRGWSIVAEEIQRNLKALK